MLHFYFLIRFAVEVLVTILLLYSFIRLVSKRLYLRNDFPLLFFLPVVLSLFLTWFAANKVLPKVLDLKNIYRQNYKVATILIQKKSDLWGSAEGDGEYFYYNPWAIALKEGKTYKISYTTYSHYIVSVE